MKEFSSFWNASQESVEHRLISAFSTTAIVALVLSLTLNVIFFFLNYILAAKHFGFFRFFIFYSTFIDICYAITHASAMPVS